MAQFFTDFTTEASEPAISSVPYEFGTTKADVMNALFRKVYQYMALGLILTSLTAYFTVSSQAMLRMFFSSQVPMVIVGILEIGLVLALSAGINKISSGTALVLFTVYSVLNGILCSSVLLVYTHESVYQAFFATAGMFGAMSLYGLYTQKDLTSLGSFLTMGLFGLIIASVINLFIGSSTGEFVISIFGIFIFLGLTAWDTWKIKNFSNYLDLNDSQSTSKVAVLGALALYLDFINIFLYLLRFFGRERN